jgi:hypothetical protein
MIVLALPSDGMDSSRSTKHKAKYKKGLDGLLPIKTTCSKLLYFSDYDSLRDVRQKNTHKKTTE